VTAVVLAWLAGIVTAVAAWRTLVWIATLAARRVFTTALAALPKPSEEEAQRVREYQEATQRLHSILLRMWDLPDDAGQEAVYDLWRESRELRQQVRAAMDLRSGMTKRGERGER